MKNKNISDKIQNVYCLTFLSGLSVFYFLILSEMI